VTGAGGAVLGLVSEYDLLAREGETAYAHDHLEAR
jgi:hypothetical protein